jgi:hypothetical protein
MRPSDERPTFLLRLRPEKGVDPIRAMRHALKKLLRAYGMQCITCEEEQHE